MVKNKKLKKKKYHVPGTHLEASTQAILTIYVKGNIPEWVATVMIRYIGYGVEFLGSLTF